MPPRTAVGWPSIYLHLPCPVTVTAVSQWCSPIALQSTCNVVPKLGDMQMQYHLAETRDDVVFFDISHRFVDTSIVLRCETRRTAASDRYNRALQLPQHVRAIRRGCYCTPL